MTGTPTPFTTHSRAPEPQESRAQEDGSDSTGTPGSTDVKTPTKTRGTHTGRGGEPTAPVSGYRRKTTSRTFDSADIRGLHGPASDVAAPTSGH